jgi:hypothetical protein
MMNWGQNSKQIVAGLTFGFLVITGTYNAVVINSESSINGTEVRFAKRLDEVYGVVISKREVATSMDWQKISVKQAALYKKLKNNISDKDLQDIGAIQTEGNSEVAAQAAVKEDLNLSLTQVINPKKWQQGLSSTQFSGSLATNNGVIESLSVSLPNDEGLSVSFSEMTGNVFEYDFSGELYSGMMYQEDENSYVVTLTNGPLEGTRLTFKGEPSPDQQVQAEESQRTLAESSDAQAGQEVSQPETVADNIDIPQPEALENQDMMAQEQGQLEQSPEQAQGFNFEEQPQTM